MIQAASNKGQQLSIQNDIVQQNNEGPYCVRKGFGNQNNGNSLTDD